MSRRNYHSIRRDDPSQWSTMGFYPLINDFKDISGNNNHGLNTSGIFNDRFDLGRNSLQCINSSDGLRIPLFIVNKVRDYISIGVKFSGWYIQSAGAHYAPCLIDLGHPKRGFSIQNLPSDTWVFDTNGQINDYTISIKRTQLLVMTPLYFELIFTDKKVSWVIFKNSEKIIEQDITQSSPIVLYPIEDDYLAFGSCPYFKDRGVQGNVWDFKIEIKDK